MSSKALQLVVTHHDLRNGARMAADKSDSKWITQQANRPRAGYNGGGLRGPYEHSSTTGNLEGAAGGCAYKVGQTPRKYSS